MGRLFSAQLSVVHWVLVTIGMFFLCGCAARNEAPVNLVPVAGKVSVDGNPFKTGKVVFILASNPIITASGRVENGAFELNTSGASGAPVGRYQVVVFAGSPDPTNPIPPRYASPEETPLIVEVTANPQPGAYDLKVTK